MHRVHTINFGCRASQADGAVLETDLCERGFQAVAEPSQADVVVLNSCTVTATADAELRQIVRRIHRENPAAKILVTGCYAQRSPEELAALPGVEWVVGNSHKPEIGPLLAAEFLDARYQGHFVPLQELLAGYAGRSPDADYHSLGAMLPEANISSPSSALPPAGPKILVGDISRQTKFATAPVFAGSALDRTRPNLKVQDGCGNRCSFCIIPSVRGRSRSLPLPDVLTHIRTLAAMGYREVVLSGINLGRYGRDLPGKDRLAELVRRILEETPVERLRLSSVEPMDFTDELLDLMASSSRIARHVHAPLQSGSDRILRRMCRKYHPHNYRERILAAWRRMPGAAFGADVMVGFPGETDEDFERTRDLIASLPFTYLHVFPFSRRPGTPADGMPDQVNGAVMQERSRILRELAAAKNRLFRERQLGRTLTVLTLEEKMEGGTPTLSDNYLRVSISGERMAANQLVPVRITSLSENGLVGEGMESAGYSTGAPAAAFPSMMTSAKA
ncbi:MAG: tRNA (N(6)-L-threonylcarbamoyladenosine(37)-C(2))-methylthiotransferase MtaB [Acidobacteria bacterium]|nr:tRNA (N(6)-L-threonylcarbamoyladenosine(37)-C(2))-methylthiotransferase MtaB [Acidobacteriota bacterium]